VHKNAYWICAYANNQWRLDDALTDDPSKTSFHEAMSIVDGTVSVVDKGGIIYSRIWCGYEAYVTLKGSRANYLWDVYTAACKGGVAAGVTDGLAVADFGSMEKKERREARFPLALAEASLSIQLEKASASVEIDKIHILNSMIGSADLNAPLRESHSEYESLNGMLRVKFALSTLLPRLSLKASTTSSSTFSPLAGIHAVARTQV
jgi:hypothetical protein